jgi:serine protease inhibitor
MRGTIIIFVVALTVFLALSCGKGNADSNSNTQAIESIKIDSTMVHAINNFSIESFKQTIKSDQDKNVFISPLSISIALGMAWNGAQGETETAMRRVLGYGELSRDTIDEAYRNLIEGLPKIDPDVLLEIANSIWIRQGYQITKQFLDLNSEYFHARVEAVDLNSEKTIETINNWVAQSTHDKIKTILTPPVHPNVMMYLINAVYFKGTWTYEFDKANTKKEPFHITLEKDTTCDMMYQKKEFPVLVSDDFQAVDLPYGNEDYSMAVFLPVEGKTPDSLLAKLDMHSWNNWMDGFRKQEIKLYLPKFKLTYNKLMNDVLKIMGMQTAFTDSADFRGMEPSGELYISRVLHKTFVQVDEKGTEAAAVTGVEMMTKAMPQPPLEIRVDRPFLFVIHEKTSGAILFMGRIMKPVWED